MPGGSCGLCCCAARRGGGDVRVGLRSYQVRHVLRELLESGHDLLTLLGGARLTLVGIHAAHGDVDIQHVGTPSRCRGRLVDAGVAGHNAADPSDVVGLVELEQDLQAVDATLAAERARCEHGRLAEARNLEFSQRSGVI